MAASDLCQEIIKQGNVAQLEEGMEKKICNAFIAHLSDKSLDVQGNAVRCIQKIAPRIRETNLIMIVKVMAELIVNGDQKDTRDIYSMAIRGITAEISYESGATMIKTLYPILIMGFGAKQSEDVHEDCIEILSEILKRFASLLLKREDLVLKDKLMVLIPE